MDFNITPISVGISVVQELWNKLAFYAIELVQETQQMVLEKDSFQDFSNQISQLNIIFQSLHSQRVEAAAVAAEDLTTTEEVLQTLNSQLRKVRNLVRDYKSGSKLRLVFKSHTFLKQMRKLSNEIAHTISTLNLANLDATLNVKSEIDQVINNLRLIEFKFAGATEAITSDIEKSMLQNERNRDRTVQLLHRIAEAVGAKVDETLVRNELQLLKQEKEEMEVQKKKAEAFHLSQLIQFLYSTEIVSNPQKNEDADADADEDEDDQEDITTYQQNMINSFTCPLCKELMKDPVAIFCGHSFERRAIEEHFSRGENTCPMCKHEILSLELTPNVSLLNSIEEWKQREMELKFLSAISGITSNDLDILNKALQDLQGLMEMPHYRAQVSEKGLIPIIVEILKANVSNTKAALKCLYYLSSHCDRNKEAIVEARAIPVIVKYLYRGGIEPDAVAILLELSLKETIGEQIGKAKYCIPVLVSLLANNNQDVSQRAQTLLQNLSSDIDFVIKMAEAGHLKPFVDCFKQGSLETRALMVTSLINIQLGQNSIKEFENKRFTRKLVQMLSSRSPALKSDCLKCIKKFMPHPEIVKSFLADTNIIPLLINLISSSVDHEETCKQAAIDVLASLVESTPLHDFQTSPHLQELQSKHISLFLDFVTTASDPQLRARSLQILLVLSHKSEISRNSIRDDEDAVASLFTALVKDDQPEVRRNVMELLYCVSKDHPAGVPLPVSPAKESAINFLVTILTSSPDIKEKSFAAAIISRLSNDDIVVDNILRRSEALKAIQEAICTVDHDDDNHVHGRIIAQVPIYPGESSMLLEESLAALLHYTHPTKPELQKQVIELQMFPSLVRVLYRGSSLAKQRAAMALAHLSEATNMTSTDATIHSKETSLIRLLPSMFRCCSVYEADSSQCSVHGSTCSPRNTFCLVKADAVRPLVQTLSETKSGAAEAALIALETLLTGPSAFSQAAAIIVDNQGVAAILEVLEKGSLSAKDKALDIFDRILQHIPLQNKQSERSERIIIHLLSEESLKRKAASVLKHMNLLPDQSSYF